MSKIFLIPGLGADTRVYNKIDLNDHEVVCINWIEPHKTDTLSTYAQRLIYHYNITPKSIVIGNSLGGMIAIEIAKIILLNKTILISSIKTVGEAPWYFRLFRSVPFYRLISGKTFTRMGKLLKPVFGHLNPEDEWLFIDMVKNSSPKFIKWAMDAVLGWDNKIVPLNVYHITGDKDMVLPHQPKNDVTIIQGGTHLMILSKAKEVNKQLNKILKK